MREPDAFSFASVVRSRHLSSRARARYSASYVLAQPRRSAIRHASSDKPFGLRGLMSAAAKRSIRSRAVRRGSPFAISARDEWKRQQVLQSGYSTKATSRPLWWPTSLIVYVLEGEASKRTT